MDRTAPGIRLLPDVRVHGIAWMNQDKIAKRHGLTLLEREIERPGVGEEALIPDMPRLFAADVTRRGDQRNSINLVADGTGVVTPGRRLRPRVLFTVGTARRDDYMILVGRNLG